MEFREDVRLGLKRPISPPLMNGGGCCKMVEHVRELSKSPAGAVLAGSFTVPKQDGNSGEVFWAGKGMALNALGLPNGGLDYLVLHLSEMVAIAHGAGKAFVLNVAGSKPDEYALLTALAFDQGVDAVELNFSCGNVVQADGSRKPLISFNLEIMEETISLVEGEVGEDTAVWAKVAPYSDPELLKKAAAVFLRHRVVKAVTAINTFPCAYGLDEDGKSLITVGFAGLSGEALKPVGLGQVKQWRDALQGKIGIIAVGGISTGRDIKEYGLLGADAFQMTTELLRKGYLDPVIFEKVTGQYLDVWA